MTHVTGIRRLGRYSFITLTFALWLGLYGCAVESDDEITDQAVQVLELPVRTIEIEPVRVSRTYTGRNQPIRDVEVRARVDGIIHSRDYSEGSLVEEGDRLFQIDPTRYSVHVQRAEAELDRARAEDRQAEREWQRVIELYEDDAISSREYESALSDRELTRAGVALAEAELANARIDLDYATVESPVTGMAGLEEQPVGSLVEVGQLLTRVRQLDPIQARFSIPEAHLNLFGAQIQSGAGFHVVMTLPNGEHYRLPGQIDFTETAVDSETGTVRMRALFPNPTGQLLPGQFVRITLNGLHIGSGYRIPHRAVAEGSEGPVVYVLDDDNRPQARPVTLDHDLGREYLVKQGVSHGDRIIVDGISSIENNVRIRPVDAPREDEPDLPPFLVTDELDEPVQEELMTD